MQFDAALDIIKMIYEAYPKAIEVKDCDGALLLHIALCRLHDQFIRDVTNVTMVFEVYPKVIKVKK